MLKYNKISKLIMACSFLLSGVCGAQVIGYGSADSVLPAKNQEAFYTGFELGLKEMIGEKSVKELLAVEQVSSGSPIGAIKSVKMLLDKKVKMFVGFPTSHEALQAAKLTSADQYLTIFPSAGHTALAEFGSTVFTTGISVRSSIAETLKMFKNRFKNQKGIFIYNPQAVFSVNQKNEIEKNVAVERDQSIKFDFAALDAALKIDEAMLSRLKKREYQYIFLTPYADESAAVLSQLNAEKIDLPIVSNSSWTSGDIEFIRRVISEKKAPIITGADWVPGIETSKYFEKQFQKKYGTAPSAESASGYDLGIIAGTVIKRAKNNYAKESLVKAFHQDLCFTNTTVGKICFPEKGGHGSKPVIFMQLTTTGLKKL